MIQISLILTIILTALVLIGIFLIGYNVGLTNAVEMSKIESGSEPIFESTEPQSWDLNPEDIDRVDDWDEFEERIED